MAPISYELISVTYDPPPPDIVLEEKVEPEGNFQLINNSDVIRIELRPVYQNVLDRILAHVHE
jgi:hypothetical protein